MSDFSNFLSIRQTYARLMPDWMEEYEATGEMRQDPYFMDWQFTPIEQAVWSDIRTLGLPFFPQVPALNYFLDFANPFLKIGIECDGKAWHDSELDKVRDARLAAAGWMIFRIEGHECKRVIEPWRESVDEEEDNHADIHRFFMTTSEGVISAIKHTYFQDGPNSYLDKYRFYIDSALFEHRSTPETYPVRRPLKKATGPVRLSDSLEGYIERLMMRAQKEPA